MQPVSIITPGVLATIAAEWSEAELHAAATVLTDLLRDRRGAVPVLEMGAVPQDHPEGSAISSR